MYFGCVLISKDKSDLLSQEKTINEYAVNNNFVIEKFVHKNKKQKRVSQIEDAIKEGATVFLTTQLSRFGKNTLEVLGMLEICIQNNVDVIFINQPFLSTNQPSIKDIYKALHEAERGFISHRTKRGLEVALAKGKILGRPKGKKNKNRTLDPHYDEILFYLNKNMSVNAIMKHLNIELNTPISYTALKYYIESNITLKKARDNFKNGSLLK